MSYVQMEETAINCAENADVTAMKIISVVTTAPLYPSNLTAAKGRTSPAVTSSLLIRCEPSSARAEMPIVLAQSQGMANQQSPPITYPGKACTGLAAMAVQVLDSGYAVRDAALITFVVVAIVKEHSSKIACELMSGHP